MNKIIDAFLNKELQPHIFSLILVVIILSFLAIGIYVKVNKQQVDKAPQGVAQIAEHYVMGVDTLFKNTTEEKISKPAPYIFTLITFLIFGNLISFLGVPAISTSYSVTLTLGFVSWIGIYVIGIIYQRGSFFWRYIKNPTDIIGQFSPLISLSFRLFGNMVGGSIIIYLLYFVTGWIWSFIPIIGEVNLLGSIIAPMFHAYFDLFSGLIQAYVFTLLTMLYWSTEAEVSNKTNMKNIERN